MITAPAARGFAILQAVPPCMAPLLADPEPRRLLALLALLLPTLTTLAPDMAGWSPMHEHIYRNGVPVPHTHPYDSAHPTEITPCVVPTDTGPATANEAPAPADPATDEESVRFTFSGSLMGSIMLPPAAVTAPSCPQVTAEAALPPSNSFTSAHVLPATPPPRA